MSKASEYAKAWKRHQRAEPKIVRFRAGPIEAWVSQDGTLRLQCHGVLRPKHTAALIAWLTDTFTDGGT